MIMFYKGMQIIPIFPDSRFRRTIDEAINSLENGVSVLIFPEDSSDGYHDEIKGFFGGFWLIAKEYKKRFGKNLKIVSMYLSKKSNKILVDTPRGYDDLQSDIKNHKDAAKYFLKNTNNLYRRLLNENM